MSAQGWQYAETHWLQNPLNIFTQNGRIQGYGVNKVFTLTCPVYLSRYQPACNTPSASSCSTPHLPVRQEPLHQRLRLTASATRHSHTLFRLRLAGRLSRHLGSMDKSSAKNFAVCLSMFSEKSAATTPAKAPDFAKRREKSPLPQLMSMTTYGKGIGGCVDHLS